MQFCQSVGEIRHTVRALRADGARIALVPTMGALHDGHLALAGRAQELADRVIASIFVNPTQFGNAGDRRKYPRPLKDDLAKLRGAGVAAVFAPTTDEMYRKGDETIVETTRLANMLHGLVRPGHFRGVTTVVCKLLNIVRPDVACFGEKDYQQLVAIRRMVSDLFLPVEIVAVATVRQADGLAMSSRNVRLLREDRAAAVALSQSLTLAETLVAQGTTAEVLKDAVAGHIRAEPRAGLRAVDIAAADLSPVSGPVTAPVVLMIAAEFGGILLTDQRVVSPEKDG